MKITSKTTWGIYGETMRGRLDLCKSGIFNRPLHLDGLLPLLARELENTDLLAVADAAWSIHLVAWAGEREVPERLLAGPRGELHVEISLWDGKGVQVPVDEGLIRLHTPAKVELPEFTLGIDPAADPAPWTGQILLVRMSPVEFAEFQDRTRQMTQILELVPADYELDDACTGEGGVVAQIYELLHGAELANPDDGAPVL